jgi:uncharacterized protein
MLVRTFVFKVASRCNLNCDYCYVYNAGDTSWRAQPTMMSYDVARAAVARIREHAEVNALDRVVVNFHGGEPLLCGPQRLEDLLAIVQDGFDESGISVSTSVQTNGVLFSGAAAEVARRRGVRYFLSVDGPPEVNDRHRVGHGGKGSGRGVDAALRSLSGPNRDVFAGCLAVVDPDNDPVLVMDYLLDHEPPVVDLLLPLHNHDRPPPAPARVYGEWLAAAFDRWMEREVPTRVRTFDSILGALVTRAADDPEATPEGSLIVETNGELEVDDTLKTAFDGAAKLGLDVFGDGLAAATEHPALSAASGTALSSTCRRCPALRACGGGHVSHRYAGDTAFDNPSVYCDGLMHLVLHVRDALTAQLRAAA